jgi:hypothetical protein
MVNYTVVTPYMGEIKFFEFQSCLWIDSYDRFEYLLSKRLSKYRDTLLSWIVTVDSSTYCLSLCQSVETRC